MADGKDCKCWAHGECECGCGADWTPQEVYDLRKRLSHLMDVAGKMAGALNECREYFDQRSDCDHNGIDFVANEENKMLGVVDKSIAEWDGIKKEGV
jgi:hypothetical protein